jgi:hypothetical protein
MRAVVHLPRGNRAKRPKQTNETKKTCPSPSCSTHNDQIGRAAPTRSHPIKELSGCGILQIQHLDWSANGGDKIAKQPAGATCAIDC